MGDPGEPTAVREPSAGAVLRRPRRSTTVLLLGLSVLYAGAAWLCLAAPARETVMGMVAVMCAVLAVRTAAALRVRWDGHVLSRGPLRRGSVDVDELRTAVVLELARSGRSAGWQLRLLDRRGADAVPQSFFDLAVAGHRDPDGLVRSVASAVLASPAQVPTADRAFLADTVAGKRLLRRSPMRRVVLVLTIGTMLVTALVGFVAVRDALALADGTTERVQIVQEHVWTTARGGQTTDLCLVPVDDDSAWGGCTSVKGAADAGVGSIITVRVSSGQPPVVALGGSVPDGTGPVAVLVVTCLALLWLLVDVRDRQEDLVSTTYGHDAEPG